MLYIYQRTDWPHLRYDASNIIERLSMVRYKQGRLFGKIESIDSKAQKEIYEKTICFDVTESSALEGEILDSAQVASSVARKLGIDRVGLVASSEHIDNVVEMLCDATQNYSESLTKERLWTWHKHLFLSDANADINRVGGWRNGAMQIVSSRCGHEKVYFEAPEGNLIEKEMDCFLQWVNESSKIDPLLKAALAHLWFETIHPFEDGNGRIGRAITDRLLARADSSARRFYSISQQIHRERKGYYEALERAQKGDLDVTDWLLWFLDCLEHALDSAEASLALVMEKSRLWQYANQYSINERQARVLTRLFEDFKGKLTTVKYAKLAKCSADTALRDIQALISYGILEKNPEGGRSTSYAVVKHTF